MPYTEPEFPDQPQNTHPPPITAEGAEDEYKVNEILNFHIYRKKLQYLVKWKNYGHGDHIWKPASSF